MAYRLTLQSPKGPRGLRKQYQAAREDALREAGAMWCREILPGHFTAGGGTKYRYQARTKSHMRRKRREGRGQDPNVYTGRLRDKMIGMTPRMTVNSKGLTMVWPGLPRYTYVVDTLQFTDKDRRWDDQFINDLRQKVAERGVGWRGVEQAVQGILRWREAHPETKGGRFKLVKRPDKVAEITRMNKADAEAVGKTFRTVFMSRLEAVKP